MALTTKPTGANWKNDARYIVLWTLTQADPIGDWHECAISPDKSVHVLFAAGTGTVALDGSNEPGEPTGSFPLRDVTHTVLAFATSGGEKILEPTLKVRPVLTGAAGGASVLVYLCVNGG